MAYTSLDGSVGGGITPATQSEVETYTGTGCITSSNIQYAIGAVTSWAKIDYEYVANAPSNNTKIVAVTGMNLGDWDIHDPYLDYAAWNANGQRQLYVGDLSKNVLIHHATNQTQFSLGGSILTATFPAYTDWGLIDPQMNTGTHATDTVYLVAVRRAV